MTTPLLQYNTIFNYPAPRRYTEYFLAYLLKKLQSMGNFPRFQLLDAKMSDKNMPYFISLLMIVFVLLSFFILSTLRE